MAYLFIRRVGEGAQDAGRSVDRAFEHQRRGSDRSGRGIRPASFALCEEPNAR